MSRSLRFFFVEFEREANNQQKICLQRDKMMEKRYREISFKALFFVFQIFPNYFEYQKYVGFKVVPRLSVARVR